MMKKLIFTLLVSISAVILLTACSTVASLFPDKEKDYQLSSELPPLKVPADISNKGFIKPPPSPQLTEDSEIVGVIGEIVKQPPANPLLAVADKDKPSAATAPANTVTDDDEKADDVKVELVKFANGEIRMQINKSQAMSWRMIGKALTRKGVEITRRDQANGEFGVLYDANGKDFKDEGFLDELMFVFSEDHNQEKSYQIKVLQRDKLTEVVILNELGQPVVDENSLSLLKVLATGMQNR